MLIFRAPEELLGKTVYTSKCYFLKHYNMSITIIGKSSGIMSELEKFQNSGKLLTEISTFFVFTRKSSKNWLCHRFVFFLTLFYNSKKAIKRWHSKNRNVDIPRHCRHFWEKLKKLLWGSRGCSTTWSQQNLPNVAESCRTEKFWEKWSYL